MTVPDMPKLQSPFVRKEVDGAYIVTPEIDPECRWVFEDPEVRAVEKLDGTNVLLIIEGGDVKMFNRTKEVKWYSNNPIVDAVKKSVSKKYVKLLPQRQEVWGEAIGPLISDNMLALPEKFFIPFSKLFDEYTYESFQRYPKTFENISSWFKDNLYSRFAAHYANRKDIFAEGVVFTHPNGRMAKLRRDMFDWYTRPRHKE